jgi:hypothetical protein
LTGVVRRNGQPLVGAQIQARGQGWKQAKTDPNGRYEFAALAAGSYELTVNLPSERWSQLAAKQVEIRAGEEAAIDFDVHTGGSIRGRVLSERTNAPLEGADVTAYLAGVPGEGWGGVSLSDSTTATGEFVLPECPIGRYTLSVNAGGHVTKSVEGIAIAGSDDPKPVEIRLAAGVVVAGRVEADGLQGAPWAGISFQAADPEVQGWGWCQIELPAATFKIDTLAPGKYQAWLNVAVPEPNPSQPVRFSPIDLDIPPAGASGIVLRFPRQPQPVPAPEKR